VLLMLAILLRISLPAAMECSEYRPPGTSRTRRHHEC
jgi:hypothetical protein